MTLGQMETRPVTFASSYGDHRAALMAGVCVYIHPKGRFYTLEFENPVTGEKFRESYRMI